MSDRSTCPGCGLELPASPEPSYDGYYNTSPECWAIYGQVLEREFANAVLFGQVHMLTVDAYAVQHAGGPHPDKSIGVHLCGLHLVLEQGVAPTVVPRLIQRISPKVGVWPHFDPPTDPGPLTVATVAAESSPLEHAEAARRWASHVWQTWGKHHHSIARLVEQHLG